MNINLETLKASGVYTFEYDASTTVSELSEYGRLLIGSSKKGPFNTIVKINNDATAKNVYGTNDKQLEKKGSYFHKSLEVLLREGPVYALNVLPVSLVEGDLNPDRGSLGTFSTDSADVNTTPIDVPVMNLFNRQKLWYASDNALTLTKNRKLTGHMNHILSFGNVGQKQATIFVRKSTGAGFDVKVSEWFALLGQSDEIPNYMHVDDLISDYMVNVIVVDGDWTNYLKLETDPVFTNYFDNNGLKISKINEFLQLRTVNIIANVDGAIVPDFRDTTGNIISIDRKFNNLFPTTGLMCAIDSDALDVFDQTLDTFDKGDNITTEIPTNRIDIVGHGVTESVNLADDGTVTWIDTLSYKAPSANELTFNLDIEAYGQATTTETSQLLIVGAGTPQPPYNYILAMQSSKLYKLWENGYLSNGDVVTTDGTTYLKIVPSTREREIPNSTGTPKPTYIVKAIEIYGFNDVTLLTPKDIVSDTTDVVDITIDSTGNYSTSIDLSDPDLFGYYELLSPNELKLDVTGALLTDTKAILDEYLKVGNYIGAKVTDGRPRMMKITSISKSTTVSPAKTFYTIKTLSASSDVVDGINLNLDTTPSITIFKGIQNFVSVLRGIKLSPFTIRTQLLPDGSDSRQDSIMKFMFDTNIASAITESDAIDIRYVVDSYEGQISAQSKYYLAKLAATHGQSMAFYNAPSMKQFEKSEDPMFVDSNTGLISTEHIANGGDLSLNPSFTFKFGSDTVNGMPIETFSYPVFPNLIITDNGKDKLMVPAPYVCNAFIKKFKANSPYSIIAGSTGRLTDPDIKGVEYELTNDDRALLEPIGYNLIVKRRNGGVMLFTNNTAYQRVKSALNNAHVRDTLITIEKNLENIVFNYLFKYNTPILRVKAKTIVDNYLEGVLNNGGIAGFETQMDETNNTTEVLESNAAILDVSIDFNRGIHKFVNKITITRAGGQLSLLQSGFSAV